MADLKARLTAAGWGYNVDSLETDPGAYLQESSGYREMLTQQAINSSVCNVLLAFAQGQYLDRLGDDQGTARMPGENDDRYRGRVQLAPEAYSATGTAGGYIYYGMQADVTIADVGCAILNRGLPSVMVQLTVMSDGSDGNNGVPSQTLINEVYSAVYAEDVKLLTDTISVVPAVAVPYYVVATLNILPGPDPAIVKAAALASLATVAAAYHRLVLGVPRSALIAALSVAGVDSVIMTSPAADVNTSINGFGQLMGSTISISIIDVFPPSEVGPF